MGGKRLTKLVSMGMVLCTAAIAAPALAADSPNYSWIGAQWMWSDVDVGPLGVDGDGPAIGFSAEVTDAFRILGGYSTADFDYGIDVSGLQLGVGYIGKLTAAMDWEASLSWVRARAEVAGISDTENGYLASLGVRGMASPKIELGASVDYVDYGGGGDSDTTLSVEGLYYVTDVVAIGLGFEVGSDITTYGIGVRYDFGR